ncbi:hypothetical protein GCM10028864_36320 [Microlunatus parietis]
MAAPGQESAPFPLDALIRLDIPRAGCRPGPALAPRTPKPERSRGPEPHSRPAFPGPGTPAARIRIPAPHSQAPHPAARNRRPRPRRQVTSAATRRQNGCFL